MIRENNKRANKTWVWTYDNAGNILSRKEYNYTTGTVGAVLDTVTYTYGDSDWGDLLTAYDGVTITYDEMGNPLSDGTRSYVWEHGRQLAAVKMNGTVWRYTYDANGMRTSRTNGTDTYSYVYNGSKLMQMTVGANRLIFTYDGNGNPSTVTLNNTTYYYVTNLQGDVVEIRNASGALVCDYSYDAWGNVVSASNYANAVLYSLNPLLYRGYVYDRDTGLYYLQSRYYNPTIGRFINADALVSTGQGALGYNMFAYCLNNPVNHYDKSGNSADSIFGWIGEEIGELIYEWITGEDHPNDQVEALENEIISTQTEMIADAAEYMWDAYEHSIEIQVQQQYQRDMAVRDAITGELDSWSNDPARAGDFAANLGSATTGYIGYAALASGASIPVLGQWIVVGVGAVCVTWSILRYYNVV